jgi:preprotein translocase subunit SecA
MYSGLARWYKQINDFYSSYRQLSNDELRSKTVEFKKRIAEYLRPIDEQIQKLNQDADALPAEDINGKDDLYKEVDELLKKRNDQIEEILKELLPKHLQL